MSGNEHKEIVITLNDGAERYKDELNLAEFPLSSLADSVPSDQKSLTFTDSIFDQGSNKPVTRKLTIISSDHYGLPRAKDEEVILGLIQLSNRAGFSDRKTYFSSYELIKILGWSDSTKSYRRIEESLNRWMSITLFYDKAWWSKEDQCWVNEKFHILDNVTIYDSEQKKACKKQKPNDAHAGKSYFVWNEKVFQSFRAGNLREIDLEIYTSLKSSISKRMFRFLDKHFYHRKRLVYNLENFAYAHIGFSRTSSLSEIKRLMLKPLAELESIGFLKPMTTSERFIKLQKGIYQVCFEHGQTEAQALMSEQEAALAEQLKERGVTASKASKMVRQYGREKICEKIALHDWMTSTGDKRCSINPAGFLVNAIESNYPLPAGFLKSKEVVKATLSVERAPSIHKRVEKEVPSEEEVAFELWWKELTTEQKENHEQAAVAQTNEFQRKYYEERKSRGEGTLFKSVQRKLILAYYRTIKANP